MDQFRQEQVSLLIAHDEASIGAMALQLAEPQPQASQLLAFIGFLEIDINPARTAKLLFGSYLSCQQKLGYQGIRQNDLLLPAQAYIRGIRTHEPLDARHRELFSSPQEFHEAWAALWGIRNRMTTPQ